MRKSGEKGSTLISVLILVVIVVLIMGAVANFITGGIQRTKATSARLQALYLAEAGVEKAIEQLKENWDTTVPSPWPGSSPPPTPSYSPFPTSPLSDKIGEYGFIIPPDGSSSGRIIAGYGKVEVAGREVIEEVRVVVERKEPSGGGGEGEEEEEGGGGLPAFDYALFAGNKITIGSPKVGTSIQIDGNVATNATEMGSVDLSYGWGTQIKGNLYIGSKANLDVEPGNVIKLPEWQSLENFFGEVEPGKKGEVDNLDETITYPTPEFPSYPTGLPERGSITVKGSETKTIDADGYYTSINVKNNTNLYIDTGSDPNGERVILVDSLSLSNGQGNIVLSGSGKLKLYVKNINVERSSAINGDGDPGRLTLYYEGIDPLTLGGGGEFRGTVVAKSADIIIAEGRKFTGNLITGGTNVTVQGGGSVVAGLIYAPSAKVTLKDGGQIGEKKDGKKRGGAVVCQNFEALGGVSIIYDESVRNIEIPADVLPSLGGSESGGGVIYISSWHSEPSQEK